MTFEEWWESEERDFDWYLPIIARAAWNVATKVEHERCVKICNDMTEECYNTFMKPNNQ